MKLRPCIALPLLLIATLAAQAGTLTPAARSEIDALLGVLARSDCQFQRNGSWHGADAARAHLQRKFDYLYKRAAVATAEQFIALAATRSSISGETYFVRCGGDAPVASADWLNAKLQQLRAARP